MYYGGDETEEGEVYDGSDQEEADSDPNATSDASPRHPKFGHSASSQASRLPVKSSINSGYTKSDFHYRRYPTPSGPVTRPSPLARTNEYSQPMHPMLPDTEVHVYNDSQHHPYDERSQFNQPDPHHPTRPAASYAPDPVGLQPRYPLNPTVLNGPPPFPFPRPQLPGLPAPPATAVGSQEEIERMHLMYQKACEFYERAAAKVLSSGLNLPLAVPPKPPPVSLLLPQSGPPPQAPVIPKLGDQLGPQYPVTSVTEPHSQPVPKTSATQIPSYVPQPETLLPSAPALSADAATYSLAYAAAYKQTVSTIPSTETGGPAPNTTEYASLWQRYMDYYLRYYMQAYASMATNGSAQPGGAEKLPEAKPTSPTKSHTSAVTVEDKCIPSKASETREDEASPSSKRTKLTEDSKDEGGGKVEGTKPESSSDEKTGSQAAPTTEQSSEASKTGPPPSTDDIKSSKCIWISNLPQGVKAVDVKERCTPYGRVQTIKIIGSRKSTPPSIYAYLVMESVEAATRLVEGLQGAKFDNQEIKVKRINALPIP